MEKTIFLIKRENIFPDWWIFKKINNTIWKLVLFYVSFFSKKSMVITDYQNKSFFEKITATKTFGEYMESYEDNYPAALDIARKILEGTKYKEYDLKLIEEEELAYSLIPYLDNISFVEKIIKKENPDKIYTLNSNFGKIVGLVSGKSRKILFVFGFFQNLARKIKDKLFFYVRFHKIPYVNRREFVKTGNILYSNKDKILVLGFDETYYGRIENLVKEIRKQRKEQEIVLCTNFDTQKKLFSQKVNFVSFGDYLTKIDKKKIKKIKKAMRIKFRDHDISELIENEINYVSNIRFPWIAFYIECTEKLLKKEKIKKIVSIDDVIPITRSIVLAGKNCGIKTLVVQNGVAEDPFGRGYLPLIANKIAVWGKEVEKYLIGFGIEKNKIAITGNIQLDKQKVSLSKEEVYSKLEIKNKNPLIVVATQAFSGEFGIKEKEIFLRACLEVAKEFPEKNFIIKLHPRETPEIHFALLNEFKPENVRIIKDIPITNLIAHSEALIAIMSSTIIEAMLLNKPIISVNLLERPEVVPYKKYKSVISVSKKEDLKKAIILLENKKTIKELIKGKKKFLKNYCYKIDEKSSERVLKILRKLK